MPSITPPPILDVPGSPIPFLLVSKRGCGSGQGHNYDFTFHDVPAKRTLAPGKFGAVLMPLTASDANLELIPRAAFFAKAGNEGSRAFEQFCGGSGLEMLHLPGSSLSDLVLSAPEFAPLLQKTKDLIDAQVKQQAAVGRVDFRAFKIDPLQLPLIAFLKNDTLAILIHGTQGLKVLISRFAVDRKARTYKGTLHFELCDHFGFGDDDITQGPVPPGWQGVKEGTLRNLWVLQHDSGRSSIHRPFVIRIIVDVPIDGSL